MQVKGKREYDLWSQGLPLSRKQVILAQCYECNGYVAVDCKGGATCPLYQYFPYKGVVREQEVGVGS